MKDLYISFLGLSLNFSCTRDLFAPIECFLCAPVIDALRRFKIETASYKTLSNQLIKTELKKKNPDFVLLKKVLLRSRLCEEFLRKLHRMTFQKPKRFEPLPVMDQICEMIMKEARSRKGNNPVEKISTVLLEINARVFAAVRIFIENKMKENKNENQ